MQSKKVIRIVIILTFFIVLLLWGKQELQIDSCLDDGARCQFENDEFQKGSRNE